MRHAVEKREEMHYEGGVEEFVKYLDRNKKAMVPPPIMIKAERDGIGVEARCGGTTATTRTCCASPTTSRSATAAPISRAFAAR